MVDWKLNTSLDIALTLHDAHICASSHPQRRRQRKQRGQDRGGRIEDRLIGWAALREARRSELVHNRNNELCVAPHFVSRTRSVWRCPRLDPVPLSLSLTHTRTHARAHACAWTVPFVMRPSRCRRGLRRWPPGGANGKPVRMRVGARSTLVGTQSWRLRLRHGGSFPPHRPMKRGRKGEQKEKEKLREARCGTTGVCFGRHHGCHRLFLRHV